MAARKVTGNVFTGNTRRRLRKAYSALSGVLFHSGDQDIGGYYQIAPNHTADCLVTIRALGIAINAKKEDSPQLLVRIGKIVPPT